MSYDKTMNFLIFDGDPNGLIMGELSNWNGRVYKISRTALTLFSYRPDCQHTGVYFLFGRDQDLNDTIYVGEAEKMLSRLKQHINDHEEWNECVVVISKDDHLNKAHVKHLEADFYQQAVLAQRYTVINSAVPTCSSVSEYDQAMLSEFIDHTRLLVNTLGYKAFERISHGQGNNQSTAAGTEYTIRGSRGAEARGISVPDGFTVLKGSRIASDITPSFSAPLQKIRNRLLNNGIVDENYLFTRDYLFSSPSTAASIVRGASTNGRTAWKDQGGRTLSQVEKTELDR